MKHAKNVAMCLALLLGLGMALASCGTSARTVATGLENTSYLHLTGDTSIYSKDVTVTLDDDVTFTATVNSNKNRSVKSVRKGETYKIAPGVHTLVIQYNGQTIVNKKIFASANEVNTVELP